MLLVVQSIKKTQKQSTRAVGTMETNHSTDWVRPIDLPGRGRLLCGIDKSRLPRIRLRHFVSPFHTARSPATDLQHQIQLPCLAIVI